MKLWRLGVVLLAIVCSSCECAGDPLERTCPVPDQLGDSCIVHQDGSWETISESEIAWEVGPPSRCRLGETKCNEATKETYCAGYVYKALEECNEIDDDCDGQVDEGLVVSWTDPDNDCDTGLGECALADKICQGGIFTCRPFREPVEEQCDGLDNDCDGTIDNIDPVSCWDGPNDAIVDETTPCDTGVNICHNGDWTGCIGALKPTEEICDGVDNDCDGEVDTDAVSSGMACGPSTSTGQCSYGTETCVNSESVCVGATYAENEGCDAVDNDCDGQVDEELYQPCSTICGVGIEQCSSGEWVGCTAQQPTLEVCDGLDNDCNGQIDEGCPCVHGDAQTCTTDIVDANGVLLDPQCGVGLQLCEFGVWTRCEFWGTFPESCNNWDDDCDGVIDDFNSACGDPETAGTGLCKLGEDHCLEGEWVGCEGAVYPEEEICDLLDNDCDGLVDEELDPDAKVDMVFVIDISGSMGSVITALKDGIAAYVAEFQDTDHLFGLIVYGTTTNNDHEVWTLPPLVDVGSFASVLAGVTATGSGIEPTYDVLLDLTDASDPLNIGWRDDATPYVVVMTDENAQTQFGVDEIDIAPQTSNCQIGNCESGDSIEIFIITNPGFFSQYDTIVYGEMDRLIDIFPADENRYTEVLRDIFQNICLY